MSIMHRTLDILKNKTIYNTDNEKYVLQEKAERTIRYQNYKLLGFLNGYAFSYANEYLSKSTLDGLEISSLYLGKEISHGSFYEGLKFFYIYENKNIYCISEQLELLWSNTMDDYIRSITVDINGRIYIVYNNSRMINIILNDGTRLCTINESDDVYNKCRLFKTYVTKGRKYMYTIGTVYGKSVAPIIPSYQDFLLMNGDNESILTDELNLPFIITVNNIINEYDPDIQYAETFIDKYDMNTYTRISRDILCKDENVNPDDEYYYFDNLIVDNDDIYVYANQYITKVSSRMTRVWKYELGYNAITNNYNRISHIEYDDNNHKGYLYFSEDMYETNGHSIGKLSTNGDIVWKVGFDKNVDDAKFSMCIYNNDIFTACKMNINVVDSYILSVNNNKVLFETKGGKLIRVIKDNTKEIYNSEYFQGFQLIGDKIKSEIVEVFRQPIMTGNEYLIDGDENLLLIETPNTHYYDKENYQYFKLMSAISWDANTVENVLSTLNNLTLVSVDGNALSTKYVYEAPSNDGELNYYPKYLSADRHIFHNDIITKKKGLKIITKLNGSSISKKKKEYFKYIYRRFGDVDIIVEFFKQSGILDTLIPNITDDLIHHTQHAIEEVQESKVPVNYDIKSIKCFSYKYDGINYPIRQNNMQIYMCKNLPYNDNKRPYQSIFTESMDTLVSNGEIKPFILFVDGKAIKWSNMRIVRDWYDSYIIVSNFVHNIDYDYNISTILLPCLIRYGEDDNILSGNYPRFLFNSKGFITNDESEIDMRIEITDKTITGSEQSSDYIKLETDKEQYASKKNILVFENNKYYSDGIMYLEYKGHNIYTYTKDSMVLFKTFYYNEANTYISHINNMTNYDMVEDDIIDRLDNETYENEYIESLQIPFDYNYTRDDTYETNVSKAAKYILEYNASLFNRYYKDKCNVITMSFKGTEILNMISNDDYLYMPRRRKNQLTDYIIMYHNGKLYNYYKEIEYEPIMFKIPIVDIDLDDTIDIVHYMNIDNNVYQAYLTTLSKSEESRLLSSAITGSIVDIARLYNDSIYKNYLDDEESNKLDFRGVIANQLRNDNFVIYANGNSSYDIYPSYNINSNIQFPVSFTYKNNYNIYGKYINTDIILEDKYYKFKKVNFVSKRLFAHMYYNVLEDTKTFILDTSFKFCHNPNQYMIFVNGIRLNLDEWNLYTMDTDPTLEDIGIVLMNTLHNGDIIDIIYVPDPYDEIRLHDYTINESGLITLDRNVLQYPFDKDLFMIYINGKKVYNNSIQNISANKIRFLEELDTSIIDITICRYVQPDNILKEVFSYKDQWSDIIDSLTDEQIKNLFN